MEKTWTSESNIILHFVVPNQNFKWKVYSRLLLTSGSRYFLNRFTTTTFGGSVSFGSLQSSDAPIRKSSLIFSIPLKRKSTCLAWFSSPLRNGCFFRCRYFLLTRPVKETTLQGRGFSTLVVQGLIQKPLYKLLYSLLSLEVLILATRNYIWIIYIWIKSFYSSWPGKLYLLLFRHGWFHSIWYRRHTSLTQMTNISDHLSLLLIPAYTPHNRKTRLKTRYIQKEGRGSPLTQQLTACVAGATPAHQLQGQLTCVYKSWRLLGRGT